MDHIDLENDSLALVLTWQSSRERYLSKKILVAGEVEQELRSIARSMLDSITTKAPTQYDPDAEQEDDECLEIPETELFDANLLESIMPGPSLETIDPDEVHKRARYFCYSIVFGPGNAPHAVFIKKANPVKRATRRYYARFSNGALHRVEQPEFQIEEDFDVLVVPDKSIIAWSKGNFEALFKSSPIVNEMVPKWIREAVSHFGDVTIDYEVHTTLAASNTFRRRKWHAVHALVQEYPVDMEIFSLAMEEAEVDSDAFFEQGRLTITAENVDDFLGIMNEDFFKGAISGRKLRAQQKATR